MIIGAGFHRLDAISVT